MIMQHAYALHSEGYKLNDASGKDFFEINCDKLEIKKEPRQLQIEFNYVDMDCECKVELKNSI